MRVRDHRRVGKRTGYPAIAELPRYDCGFWEPCFGDVPAESLQKWYNEFRKSSDALSPCRKENHYLLSHLLCPLLTRTVSYCNTAFKAVNKADKLSALFTVSYGRIANVRRILDYLNKNPSEDPAPILEEAERVYCYRNGHPMSKLRLAVREKIETYLDMALRPDHGASDGVNVCRVYSPEINTQDKLKKLLADQLKDDEMLVNPISSTTLQRMIKEYLDARNCRISFTQSDHNACPNCKAMQHAVLQFSLEKKKLSPSLSALKEGRQDSSAEILDRIESLEREVKEKKEQKDSCFMELKEHLSRDARIRGFLKQLTDSFRNLEKRHQQSERKEAFVSRKEWNERKGCAIMSHQGDMTKVDLPSFIVNASSDITRWRYDINAHVNAITGDAVIFSHEQGAASKDASSLFELILLDHVLRCRGESIKIIVSDNAAVGKNCINTIALPQYIVDQGLADVCMVVFLENNHGKWLADMLFGQLQIRKRRNTIPGVDAILSEFESINKKNGTVQSFLVNPLSCVNFSKVLSSLGYQTKPSQDFAFVRRNIHFATACAPGALDTLRQGVKEKMRGMLPSDPGMVRICSEPPSNRPQDKIPYDRRYFDVPAAQINDSIDSLEEQDIPLAVTKDQSFKDHGPCVVSSRNMDKVGYNGFEFRRHKAYPELQNVADPLVKQTWPPGLLRIQDDEERDRFEPVNGSEYLKCSPENWIARRPVRHFRNEDGDFVARYPPRNILNAKYLKGPREEFAHEQVRWQPMASHDEAPFPMDFANDICAFPAINDLKEQNKCLEKYLTILDLLKCVFARIGDRRDVSDPWLHKPVTRARQAAIDKYRRDQDLFSRRETGHPKTAKTVRHFLRRTLP